ncbi:MAG: DNA mismatch repair protein MutS [Desulfobacterales bacterium]|nr:MAG: DNA mismatch repair protein MutS [Desulfobacterales bacterium]
MLRQYQEIKAQTPDAILFYRMGDFYEMFFEDAEIASRVLEITLTSRNKKDKTPVPMCGVPYRAVQGYAQRLIAEGFKVAICDQTEDPSQARGLVRREVTRIMTPGMILENEFLEPGINNFILAAAEDDRHLGIATLDISTAAFRVTQSENRAAVHEEILRTGPSEVLLPAAWRNESRFRELLEKLGDIPVTWVEDRWFDWEDARLRLIGQFETMSLEGYGAESFHAGVSAAGALLFYVRDTQRQEIRHLGGLEVYMIDDYLWVDDNSRRNLELTANIMNGGRKGSLLEILDKTVTAMGARNLRRWLRYPLLDQAAIEERLSAVGEAGERIPVTDEIRRHLRQVHDLERLSSRISLGRGNARDLTALKKSLFRLPDIVDRCREFHSPLFSWKGPVRELLSLAGRIDEAIREDAPPVLNEGGMIREGYNAELDELISISTDGKSWLARLEAREKDAHGIGSLKVRFNKVFGYYIEIPKTHSAKVPAHYVRKQTLVNAERYITDELKGFENRVLGAEDRRGALEYRIFSELRETVGKENFRIQEAARFIARADTLLALAAVAEENNYCRPEINMDGRLLIEAGRHPVIEKMISGERFVPNTIRMDKESGQVLIITGPNMAGKSTVLRQTALITIMAQMGSWVPADFASVSITDRVFTRVGALDNLSRGQSTFMVEMQETADILNNATPDSLVILDEIGRGTSTFDGLSIAWAVAEYLHDLKDVGVKTLFATHYHELVELAATKKRVGNYHIAVKEAGEEIVFLRKLTQGGTNRSYGIHVARLAGIPRTVIERASAVLQTVEKDHEQLPRELLAVSERKTPFQARRAVQLRIFSSVADEIAAQLKDLDINLLTPLQALNLLGDLKEKAGYY